MAQCKWCGKGGWLTQITADGLCVSCARVLIPILQRETQILIESITIVRDSKNWKTRIARIRFLEESIGRLRQYEARGVNPYPQPLDQVLKFCADFRQTIADDAATAAYEAARAKAQIAPTTKARVNAAAKGLLALREIACEFGSVPLIEATAKQLRAYSHQTELRDHIAQAEKAEFKGNFKKAVDRYQDALFFLRQDHIPDVDQANTIARLEQKITELQGRAKQKPTARPKLPAPPD